MMAATPDDLGSRFPAAITPVIAAWKYDRHTARPSAVSLALGESLICRTPCAQYAMSRLVERLLPCKPFQFRCRFPMRRDRARHINFHDILRSNQIVIAVTAPHL